MILRLSMYCVYTFFRCIDRRYELLNYYLIISDRGKYKVIIVYCSPQGITPDIR